MDSPGPTKKEIPSKTFSYDPPLQKQINNKKNQRKNFLRLIETTDLLTHSPGPPKK